MTLLKIYKFFVRIKKKVLFAIFEMICHDVEIIADFPRTVPGFFRRFETVKNP
jgi:hypothetical protein